MEIQRRLNLKQLLEKKSFFLMGPRSTGKSTLIHQQLKEDALILDLLEDELYLRLSSHPQELEKVASAAGRSVIVLDEIQKIPHLLNEVHRLIEKKKWRFLLTGSSARKLKGNASNLLAGRAWVANLFPLSWCELTETQFDLEKYLLFGGLPQVYLSDEPHEELAAYVRTYLAEEIRAEALVRNVPVFTRFLEVAALSNGQLINFTQIGSDSHVAPSTVREHYFVLEDTLMGILLQPWAKSKKRKAIQTAKFYFFDTGVVHALAGIKQLDRHSNLYGNAFEHFIGMELRAYLSYTRKHEDLKFWRSVNDQEVDYVIGDEVAIEVKSTAKIAPRHLSGLRALAEERAFKKYFLISHDALPSKQGEILCLPWEQFLERLWADDIL
ncbi:MAG: ATP-binding protein [Deltaproteobacteria bacterium]|nr:ATP-binding protein [Deltaproteobacteria bacterium]